MILYINFNPVIDFLSVKSAVRQSRELLQLTS